jgi:transposase-like protein
MLSVADLTAEDLTRLYLSEGLTEAEIARMYDTHQVRVGRLRKQWGIPTLGKTGRITKSLPPLTEVQKELLTGSLLGDGYLASTGFATARFAESHSEAQREYLDWKVGVLGPYASSVTPTEKRVGDKVFRGFRINGVACVVMRELYDLFYPAPDRRRSFPADLHTRMTPLVLAVWYMDDGSLGSDFHPRITFGLDEVSLHHAVRALRKLGLRATVHRGNKAWDITFPGQARKFFRIVRPHIPPCMAYKVGLDSARRKLDLNARRLTADRARSMYAGGMSFADIARTFGVGATTVRRRVLQSSVKIRMGRPRKQYDRVAADVALATYTPSMWVTLTDTDRSSWVEEVLAVLRHTPFPIPRDLVDSEFDADVDRVRHTVMRLEGVTIQPWTTAGSRACLPYFPNRYRAASRGVRTAYEAWHDDDVLRKAIRFQLDHGDPVLPHRVLRAVTMQHRTPSVFRATVARWVYNTYCPAGGAVWDPCAGYGGRLLGAATSTSVGRYIGTDVEPATVDGNNRLAARLGCADRCSVHEHRAEDYDPGPVDLVFTSPPYFDREQYSTSQSQSWVRHGAFEQWIDGFLRPVIAMAHARLPVGGALVLNVADIRHGRKKYPLVEHTVSAAVGGGFVLESSLWMPLARINRTVEDAREPVLVFRRTAPTVFGQ